jgi:lipopolysaccharide export system permease protein
MFLGLFNRTLLLELVRVFALSLAGMTGIFVFFGVVQTASQNGLSFAQILAIIPLVVPMSWPYTIPATTLFASCVVYGRLSNDNEAVALKAAGVDLLNTVRPALVLGLLTTAATAALLHTVVPRALQRQEAEFLRDPEETMYNLLKRDRVLRASGDNLQQPAYSLYIRDVQNRELKDVVVKRRPAGVRVDPDTGVPRTEYDFVARAPTATLRVNLDTGKLLVDMPLMSVWGSSTRLITRDSPVVEIDLPEAFTTKGIRTRPQGVTWDELPARLGELARRRADLEGRRADTRRVADDPSSPPELAANARLQEPQFAAQVKETDRQMRSMEYEYQARPALAVGCLIFAVIGCPVGLWFSRSDYLSTFVVCFLPSMILYYSATFAGGGLARDGKVPMAVGVWAADVLLGLVAVVLAWRLIKR